MIYSRHHSGFRCDSVRHLVDRSKIHVVLRMPASADPRQRVETQAGGVLLVQPLLEIAARRSCESVGRDTQTRGTYRVTGCRCRQNVKRDPLGSQSYASGVDVLLWVAECGFRAHSCRTIVLMACLRLGCCRDFRRHRHRLRRARVLALHRSEERFQKRQPNRH